jgi:HPt (histidine-containing phosphotransfer) domain-containing protein
VAGFFADSFAGLLDDLEVALEEGEDEEIVRAAHSAKGAARNGAAPQLAALMTAVEKGARAGDDQATQKTRLTAARGEFARLRQWLEAG